MPTPTNAGYRYRTAAPPLLATNLRFDNVRPNRGPSGTRAHLIGSGFGSASGQVQISGATATVLSWSDTTVFIRIKGSRPGQKGVRIIRADGRQSPIRPFRLMH